VSSRFPVIKQIGWLSLIPQLTLLSLIIIFFYSINSSQPFLYGACIYLVVSFLLRNIIARSHRKGISLTKRKEFEKAIPCFQKSYDFFSRHPWLDTYRYILILSSSRISYREMALVNIAFCYSQINRGPEAKLFYERTLKEFLDSEIAKSSLNMINSVITGQGNNREPSA
jgi:hypothetical protein